MRLKLRLKIIEHFLSNRNFAKALQNEGLSIDETVISRIISCQRNPTEEQRPVFEQLLKTSASILFKEVPCLK